MNAEPEPRLETLSPYLVATKAVAARLDPAPRGRPIAPEHTFDPLLRSSAPFLHRVEKLDHAEYEAIGMTIPRWALYDCAELPGLITGLGRLEGDDFSPCSMLIAIPTVGEGRWLLYAMGASAPHLRFPTLALGLSLIRAGEITATLQWSSPELGIYSRFAPLEIRATWLRAHDVPATCALRFRVDPDRIDHAFAGPDTAPLGTRLLNIQSDAVLQDLQRTLDKGLRVQIVGSPFLEGGAMKVPFFIGDPR